MKFIKLTVLLYGFFINSAEAVVEFFDLEKIKDWRIIAEIDNKKKFCHAIMTPYKSKSFFGEISKPKFIVSYRGHLSYSISFGTLTNLALSKNVILSINDSKYVLKTNKSGYNAITYSPEEDVDIVNDIIYGPYIFKIRSDGRDGELGVMYFSSIGFKEAILYMENNCRNL